MIEDGEHNDGEDMELGELDLLVWNEAKKNGNIECIPADQLKLFANIYMSIHPSKETAKREELSQQEMGKQTLGLKQYKRRDVAKIQSDTPKKARKSNRQLIKELGVYLLDSRQGARIDSRFYPTV